MTHEDSGGYAAKHPAKMDVDPKIAKAVGEKQIEGKITCAAAHCVAERQAVSPAEVGLALDLVEIRITKCQMGLFGYYPEKKIVKAAESVKPDLKEALLSNATGGRIACAACWSLAKQQGHSRLVVADACEALFLKVSPCQLGAF